MVVNNALVPVSYLFPASARWENFARNHHGAHEHLQHNATIVTVEPGEDGIVYGPDGQKISKAPPGHLIDIYV